VSDRRAAADATLTRLGLDPEALARGEADEQASEILRGPDGAALAAALGDVPSDAAARVLAGLETQVVDRATRKEIRRALYRLRQRGIEIPAHAAPEPAAVRLTGPVPEGLVSAFDGRGDRVIWLMRALDTGTTLLIATQVNEPEGLRDVHVGEVSRKQLRAARQRLAGDAGLRMVTADWRSLDALVVEAQERGGTADTKRDYLRVRPRLTSEPPALPAELTSPQVKPATEDEAAALVAASAELLEQPELRTWWPSPEQVAPFLAELEAARESPIVLSPVQSEDRIREVLGRAAREIYPPAVIARRLEGTAYVLAETGRVAAARQAIAVAATIRTRPDGIETVPLLATLVQRGIGMLLATATQRHETQREGALVLTPGEVRARSSSHPRHTRG